MAPKVSEEHMEARKGQILTAAIACFSEKGFHKTSMKDICTQAALSPGAVYSYYKSKDEIIESVCRSGEEMNRAIFQSSLANANTPRAQIEANLAGYRALMDMPDIIQCLRADIMFIAESLSNDRLSEMGKQNFQSLFEQLGSAVKGWQKAGFINPDLDTQAVTRVLISMVQGLSLQRVMDPEMDLDAYFDVIKSLVFGEFNTSK